MDIIRGKLYAVITGDIVGSTKLPDNARIKLHEVMQRGSDELRQVFSDEVLGNIDIFRGDSWQLVVSVPARALKIALFFRAFLRAKMQSLKVDTRIAIAVGTINFIFEDRISSGDGEAFQKSGRLLEKLTKPISMGFVFSGRENETIHLALEIIVELLDRLAKTWTEKQAEAISGALKGWTQEKISREWQPKAISQQAVAQHLERAEWSAVEKAIKSFERCLNDLIADEELT